MSAKFVHRRVPLKSLQLDEKHSVDQAVLARLRASLAELGLISAIVVDADWRVLDGHHRVLAARQAGETNVEAFIVSDALDAVTVRLHMEAARKPLDAGALAEWSKRYEADPKKNLKPAKRAGKSGISEKLNDSSEGTHVPSGAAARLAEVAGLTRAAAEKRITRAKRALAPKPEPPAPTDELGNVLSPAIAGTYAAAAALCDAVERHLVAAQAEYTRHKNAICERHNGAASAVIAHLGGLGARMDKEIAQAAHVARSHRPHALCPVCKGHDGGKIHGKHWPGRAGCEACRGLGWVGKGVLSRTEEVLAIYGPQARVCVNGKIVAVSEIA